MSTGASRRPHTRPPSGLFVISTLSMLAISVGLAGSIFFGLLQPAWGVAAVAVGVTWLFWHARGQVASVFLVFLSALLLGAILTHPRPKIYDDPIDKSTGESLAREWSGGGRFERDLPIVLHVVLDELIAPGAIPDDMEGGPEIRQSLYDLTSAFGLRVYDSVYSRNFFSAISLPNVVNAEYAGLSGRGDVLADQQTEILNNHYFADMEARGYRTAVFQTAHMNFCASRAVDLCETFHSFDPGGDGGDQFDLRSRLTAIALTIARAHEPSYTAEFAIKVLYKASEIKIGNDGVLGLADRYDVQRFPRWFDRFAAFAARVPRGTHLFAHFMVPHSPYLLTSECRLNGHVGAAGYYLRTRFPADERRQKRAQYYAQYFAQTHCARSKIAELLEAIRSVDHYADARIVIHGDHGSRISSGNVLEDLSTRDFIDNYGTFFAVKSPGVTSGIDCAFISLGEALRTHLSGEPHTPSAEPLPVMVISRDASGERVDAPMPRFGCAADAH
jgi:hypothetical protein